jgi:hypothetical protein
MTLRDIRHAAIMFNACRNVGVDVLIEYDRRNVLAEMSKVRHRRSQRMRLISFERALRFSALVNFLFTSICEIPD